MIDEILNKEFNRQRGEIRSFNDSLMMYNNFKAIETEFDCLHFVLNEIFPKKHTKALAKWNKQILE